MGEVGGPRRRLPSPLREPLPFQTPRRDPRRDTCSTWAPRSETAVRRNRARTTSEESGTCSWITSRSAPPTPMPAPSKAVVRPGRIRASPAAGRTEGGPPRPPGCPYLEASARSDPRRKERRADRGPTFAGGLGSTAWGLGAARPEVAQLECALP